jgi:hypothetical protein
MQALLPQVLERCRTGGPVLVRLSEEEINSLSPVLTASVVAYTAQRDIELEVVDNQKVLSLWREGKSEDEWVFCLGLLEKPVPPALGNPISLGTPTPQQFNFFFFFFFFFFF